MSEPTSKTDTIHLGVRLRLLCSWLVVGTPLAWGIWETLKKALALFVSTPTP